MKKERITAKEEALSHEALRNETRFYRGAHLGEPLDEAEGNLAFDAPGMSHDLADENELDAMLTEAGVEGPDEDSADFDEDNDLEAGSDDLENREDESDLDNLPNELPLRADRSL